VVVRDSDQLRDDALQIWCAGVEGVHPERLVPEWIEVGGDALWAGDEEISLAAIGRIVVVGGGKAGAAMAAALEHTLGEKLLRRHEAVGLVNVPDGARVETAFIRVNAVRRQGVNEPTEAAAAGVDEMLRLVAGLGPDDLCFCLLSGGGSALLPAPIAGFSLADKAAVTRELSARGATIHELNAVRRVLSRVKGGGLARACGAGRLVSLILSDVPGDDLSTIASGPTVECESSPGEARRVLTSLHVDETPAGRRAVELLESGRRGAASKVNVNCRVTNLVIGNNATAVDAAGAEAERLGYSHAMISAAAAEGAAEEVAVQLTAMARRMRDSEGPDCLISGGEPTVRLAAPDVRGLGGRNQQLCLAALMELDDWAQLALVSGGTDGEDGPTDAAGAWVDERVAREAVRLGLDGREFLARNDAYHFFERVGGLLKTGMTRTNVGDLRVVCVSRSAQPPRPKRTRQADGSPF
jgi:hydroxypyruvate reductase